MSPQDFRGNLILLIRLLQIDTVLSYDHWGLYEENPDKPVTAAIVKIRLLDGRHEQGLSRAARCGIETPWREREVLLCPRVQFTNRVVDINRNHRSEDRIDPNYGKPRPRQAQRQLHRQWRRKLLPILGDDDETDDRGYIEHIVLDENSMYTRGVPSDKEIGAEYGFAWAERFRYVGPNPSRMDQYIAQHAIAL